MIESFWKRATPAIVVALLMLPLHVTAGSLSPGGPAAERQQAFTPEGVELEIVEYLGGFDSPVHIGNAGDGSERLFITERRGVVWIVENDQPLPEPFLDISDIVRDEDGEQGFFGIEFHPEYATNGYVYAVYTKQPAGANILARFQVSGDDPNRLDPESLTELLSIPDTIANHNGGDIDFGPDGYLYYGAGDEGGDGSPNDLPQDGQSLFGKMLRLDVDGGEPYAIPPDNPFLDDPDIRDEIWSLGLRNPWRFAFDSLTGDLFIGDVGESTWEEINLEPAGSPGGLNYGWQITEGFECYPPGVEDCDMTGLTMPILVYSHEGEPGEREGCSVTGGEVYRGADYPFMDGAFVFADWCEGRIWAGYQDEQGEWQMSELLDTFINWTSLGVDEAGEIYGADLIGGRIFRFEFVQERDASVLSLRPAGAIAGSGDVELTVAGNGFAETTEVLWNGEPLPTEFIDATEVRAAISEALLASTGVVEIAARNGPEGSPSASLPFAVSDGLLGDPAFASIWSRTDRPVADGTAERTWIWGPEPIEPARIETYDESPGSRRMVLYFDKSRMEISQPESDPSAGWYVTNGLLVVELISGQMQFGDVEFQTFEPADIPIAGDAGSTSPTYAEIGELGLMTRPARDPGTIVDEYLYRTQPDVSTDDAYAAYGLTAEYLAQETGHTVAGVFWEFMNSSDTIWNGTFNVEGPLFPDPFYATGYPITEAYWTTTLVGGEPVDVLWQCFERRCLTYTPANPPGWQVEAGNVGLHYHSWRYGE